MTSALLLFGVGCAGSAQYSATATVDTPQLILIEPDVQVVADYHEPVFYSENYYWRYDNGVWYRSNNHVRGWVRFEAVPARIRRIERPTAYVRYRGEARGNANGHVRDHRDHQPPPPAYQPPPPQPSGAVYNPPPANNPPPPHHNSNPGPMSRDEKDIRQDAREERKEAMDKAKADRKDDRQDAKEERKEARDAAKMSPQDAARLHAKDAKQDAKEERKEAKAEAKADRKDEKADAKEERKEAKQDMKDAKKKNK